MIGNCQGSAIAQAMRLLLPDAEIVFEPVGRIARRHRTMADLCARLAGFDAVFAMGFGASFADGGTFETLREATRLTAIPVIVFPAFHPDLVYVGDMTDLSGRLHVRSPIGPYNSALALYGYLSDLSVEQTLRLFHPDSYGRLGYLGLWEGSASGLLKLGRDAGYDLADDLARWSRRGVFMHSTNHPKMFVACDLARGLLARAGIAFADLDLESYVQDELLLQGSWPVYPAVAELFGVTGGYLFVGRTERRNASRQAFALGPFVAASFERYARKRRAELGCARVESWLADDAIRAALRERAGR